ncbi:MAG: hypothetical protein LBK82_17565 [Planctomycetaceae bacterium]|jgi:hypothetical protein|nr:hypothetical protein [Planctomycetaceae bacterium]
MTEQSQPKQPKIEDEMLLLSQALQQILPLAADIKVQLFSKGQMYGGALKGGNIRDFCTSMGDDGCLHLMMIDGGGDKYPLDNASIEIKCRIYTEPRVTRAKIPCVIHATDK